MTEFLSSMEFLMQQYEAGNVEEKTWFRWSKTLDWWLTFPGIRASWVGRATPYTESFTLYIEDRLVNGAGAFNTENNRHYMLTGQTPGSQVLEELTSGPMSPMRKFLVGQYRWSYSECPLSPQHSSVEDAP
jgi:hypothetical protein